MIESDAEDGTVSRTYIRFETFNKMKAWMSDIRNEAQSFALPDEECLDWWTALFSNVSLCCINLSQGMALIMRYYRCH